MFAIFCSKSDIYQKLKREPGRLELFGTGQESRDYIYIQDMVSAIDCIIQKGPGKCEVYNLASGIETTIAEVVELYCRALGATPAIDFNGQVRQGDPLNWKADITSIRSLGFNNQYHLQSGITGLAKWITAL